MSSDAAAPRPKIVLTVGLPGSGKSTYLAKLGVTPLSSDEVRRLLADDRTDQTIHARVFATIRYLLGQRIAIGRPVTYIDATHLRRKERRPYLKIASQKGCSIEALYFATPVEICLERNARRERVVPVEAILKMAKKLQPPSKIEGFDAIVSIAE